MKVTLFSTGYCKQREALSISGGSWRSIRFHAIIALIEHPQLGPILFDTGYSPAFNEATRSFPYNLYRKVTPVHMDGFLTAAEHVRQAGYKPEEIRFVFLSHFHADHICGLSDFTGAQFICSYDAYTSLESLRGVRAVKRAFLPALLPGDFKERAVWLEDLPKLALPAQFAPFTEAYDVFGDGELAAVALPGHADPQYGLIIGPNLKSPVFLGADASWSLQAVLENRLPHPLAFFIFDHSSKYKQTFERLHELKQREPGLNLLFTHGEESLALCGKAMEV
ncbi:MBL fold metallo-hydrolase [Paenibacillus sp. CAA11]|uniref:MBL fold metallo-hydrolase n=1 Tax=Paenibacillus sp. CAA11 TaxID=1532905 RepID=UPI000D39E45D|nr:MBL fold metallo-hydrolase [Paenibacillus sp. CAA11]AWB45632.1 MBL fold metallo-hydrolase [Paenibacillus sp. CAA11]